MRATIITSILIAGCLRPASAAAQERIDPMAASMVPWYLRMNGIVPPASAGAAP